ncbi:MAG: hypothetical protein H7256_05915 [Bdellovibrio sp.]|nr:hypothetical protein [Bdellovibrio sp.]
MKTLPRLILAFSVLSVLITSNVVIAEKLDLATHNSLIEKLESVSQSNSKDSMFLETNLASRLADLYAERARLLAADHEGQGEKIHAKQIAEDRKKSIAILTKISNSLAKDKKGPALMQTAHLYILQGENDKALKIYQQIEKNKGQYDAKTNAVVETQLGDVAFFKSDYDQAKLHFGKALAAKENPRRAYGQWRLAWTNYNQGQTQLAEKQLTDLLKNKNLFVGESGVADVSFQEDVSHDLALFMAKNDINKQSIQTLSTLSPETAVKKNLIFLATELDRTSKKESALAVWKVVGAHEISYEDHLDKQIQITRIQYDLGHKDNLLIEIDRSIILLKEKNCDKNESCTVARQNLRRVITDWAKAEERAPSAQLISAFSKYTKNFDDYEMSYWAAQAATLRKQYKDAYQFHIQTVSILASVKPKDATQTKMFEGALLGSIEVAELSKDSNIRIEAYKRYLEVNPEGQKASEVKYQIAHSYYEKNEYVNASSEFRKLAADKKMTLDLREKAADLSLDSEVMLKNESAIEAHSLELAAALPSKKAEYLAIYRKSVLNQTARILNAKAEANYQSELQKITAISLASFPHDQSKQMIKNRIELSFRLKDIDSLSKNAQALLAMPKITFEEKKMAIGHLAWIAEIKMNFKEAIKLLAKVQPANKERADYTLKMATLKELAQENPTRDYEAFLSLSNDPKKRQFAAHQIVLNSNKPNVAFKKYESILAKNKSLYNSAGVYAFEKTKDQKLAKQLLTKPSFAKSTEGVLVQHAFAFPEFIKLRKEIAATKLTAKSDAGLKKVLVQRNKQLKTMETLANKAIRAKDTSLQLIYLTSAAEQNNRLAQDILSLPTPKGLKANEKAQYQAQVQAMVEPYLVQAQAIEKKSNDIWKQAIAQNTFQELTQCLLVQVKPGCQLAATEMKLLSASARQTGLANTGFENLSETRQKTLSEAQSLQKNIEANPFNFNDLAKMKTLQISLGRGPMVAYLDSRLNELQRGRN